MCAADGVQEGRVDEVGRELELFRSRIEDAVRQAVLEGHEGGVGRDEECEDGEADSEQRRVDAAARKRPHWEGVVSMERAAMRPCSEGLSSSARRVGYEYGDVEVRVVRMQVNECEEVGIV